MKSNNQKHAYLTGISLIIVIIIGTVGYYLLGFTPSEAIYQTIITIATVGFEEVHQLDNRGMWFTSFLVVVSIGIFFYAVTSLTRFIVEGVFLFTYKDKKVKRKIDKISDHVVICGYGRNGKQAAQELSEHDVKVVIVEQSPELVQFLRESSGLLYVEGDASDEQVLKQARLDKARALITTLPEDADNLFVVLTARELNSEFKIISRASVDNADSKLKRAGATHVIMPDKVGGQSMAKLVAQPDVVEFIHLMLLQSMENVVLKEISCKDLANFSEGRSLKELDIRNTTGANIIGMKREDNSYLINPVPETALKLSDKLFVLGARSQIDQLIKRISLNNTGN